MTIPPEIIAASHAAEKQHVRQMEDIRGLQVKPFLDGASLNVDRAKAEIAIFFGILDCLPPGPGALILDVGAGPCWVSEWLQKLHYRTISVDLAPEMLGIGKTRLAPGSWLVSGDMAAIPLGDNSVAAVVCYGALHHVPNWRTALKELHRVLRPHGVLVLQEPGRGHHKQPESIAQMEQFGVLEQELPPRTLARACRRAGFAKAIVRPIAEVGFGPARILPSYPFFRNAPFIFVHQRWRRLQAELVERCLNLFSKIHLVVAVKGKAYFDSRRPNIMVARFDEFHCPSKGIAGRPLAFNVRIRNIGLTTWLAADRGDAAGRVRLGISLLDDNGRIENLDFGRLDLPHDTLPGEVITLAGDIPPIDRPGHWRLRFDLVAEGVCWFNDVGTVPVEAAVEVQPA